MFIGYAHIKDKFPLKLKARKSFIVFPAVESSIHNPTVQVCDATAGATKNLSPANPILI